MKDHYSKPYDKYDYVAMALLCVILGVVMLCFSTCTPAHAEPNYEALANAIHHAENGARLDKGGEAYGIHSVHYKDENEARQICLRTCKRAWARYIYQNRTKNSGNGLLDGYFAYLSKRYCPINSKNWLHMVRYFYFRSIDKHD